MGPLAPSAPSATLGSDFLPAEQACKLADTIAAADRQNSHLLASEALIFIASFRVLGPARDAQTDAYLTPLGDHRAPELTGQEGDVNSSRGIVVRGSTEPNFHVSSESKVVATG